jgi:outer membrane protein TolC
MLVFLIAPLVAFVQAETRTLSLKEAVQIAVRENPDVLLARLEEQKAALAVRVARDPFRPKVYTGSGLAYSNGFPMSIEGSAPTIVQARAVSSLFNKSHSYNIARTAEEARTAAIDTQMRRDDLAWRTALLYLDAAHWSRAAAAIQAQAESLEKSAEAVRFRVREGRELEIENKRAALAIAKTGQRLEAIGQEREWAETSLAVVLGMMAGDRVRAIYDEPLALELPPSEKASTEIALKESREVRRLESALLAKGLEARQHRSARLPTFDLVAQYGLFARFNNYEDFFRKFQRHNGQIGLSVQIPIVPSTASDALAAQADAETTRLRTQLVQVRNRISIETRKAFAQLRLTARAREVARLDLEVAREQVSLLLAQMEEGRATLRQIEEARFLEQEKWLAYYESQIAAEKAKLDLLHQTGTLLAELR